MNKSLDILAFAPHPDDAEIGCGGSLILAAKQGLRVAVADLTKAEFSTRGNLEQRQEEVKTASKRLGLAQRFNLGLPDTKLGTDPNQRDPLIQLIRETRPQIVLAPYGQDRHPDHAATGKLVQEAFFFAGVAKVGSGEPYRPQRLYSYMLHHPFKPSFVIDVTAVWQQKMAAIEAFASQFKPATESEDKATVLNQPNFLRFIEARAIYFGAMIGAAYGEAFYALGPLAMGGFPGVDQSTSAGERTAVYSVYSP
jgi:bacillithiol biosynthesis deacetylase BshB1